MQVSDPCRFMTVCFHAAVWGYKLFPRKKTSITSIVSAQTGTQRELDIAVIPLQFPKGHNPGDCRPCTVLKDRRDSFPDQLNRNEVSGLKVSPEMADLTAITLGVLFSFHLSGVLSFKLVHFGR